jgi:hypothetical protein
MDACSVLQNDEAGVIVESDAEVILTGVAAVSEESLTELRIGPCPYHHPRPERRRARIEDLDLATDLVGAEVAARQKPTAITETLRSPRRRIVISAASATRSNAVARNSTMAVGLP